MKKYLPSGFTLMLTLFIVGLSITLYGTQYPATFPFASIINSHPIGSSIAFIVILFAAFGAFMLLATAFMRYDKWLDRP